MRLATRIKKKEKGYTLIEVLISLVILTLGIQWLLQSMLTYHRLSAVHQEERLVYEWIKESFYFLEDSTVKQKGEQYIIHRGNQVFKHYELTLFVIEDVGGTTAYKIDETYSEKGYWLVTEKKDPLWLLSVLGQSTLVEESHLVDVLSFGNKRWCYLFIHKKGEEQLLEPIIQYVLIL